MDLRKSSETRPRARGERVDAAFTCGFLNSSESLEMQNSSTAEGSVTEITKAKRRSQNKPWAIGYARKNSMPAEKKALSSKPSFEAERRISQPVKHSAGNKHEKKVKFWQENSKINVPKRWFIEYDRRQAEIRKQRRKNLQPLDRFRHAVRLIQTCNTAFQSIVHYAVEKGQHEQVNSETTLSLKSSAAVKGSVENLLFDLENYKCHHQFMMPRWAKDIAGKEPEERTKEEIHSLVRLMKQLKGFRRYSIQMQEAICKAVKYDCFGRRRVVIRKGHVAQRFYFIFSGSVCVTVDDDEHSAFAQPSENAVLSRGDYFGELAFIRGLKRAATIVCLERTEFLSVEKEDFFAAKIDLCFYSDMQRRIDYLKQHRVFSTWPNHAVKKVAEECKIREYNTDEVIVRDSTKQNWVVFVTKGQCDVMRLLDLSNCKEYVKHAMKYRMDKLKDDGPFTYSADMDEFTASSIASRGFPKKPKPPSYHRELVTKLGAQANTKAEPSANPPTGTVPGQPSTKEIRHSDRTKERSMKSRVSFDDESAPETPKPPRSPLSLKPVSIFEANDASFNEELEERLRTRNAGVGVGVGVLMAVDRLHPGQLFGVGSLLDHVDKDDKTTMRKKKQKRTIAKERRFILVSGGCEVIKVAKEVFFKHSDSETVEKLQQLTAVYPEDKTLCRTYLQQSDWRKYREEIVDNVVVRHIASLETAKGSARSYSVRSSPVPSPLYSSKLLPSVNSKWEYFPQTGWVSTQVIRPAIEGRLK